MLPDNIQAGTIDPLPQGVFLVPLCTTAEAIKAMTYALDSAYVQSRNLLIIKDFLNALQYISNPYDAVCMSEEPPVEPVVTVEIDGDCKRVLIDGIAVTDWICSETIEREPVEPVVGTLGFTVTELEEIAMGCLNLTDSLRWVNGVLEYRTCDGWKPVPGIAGAVQTSAAGSAATEGITLGGWQAAGSPALPTQPEVISQNAAYTTMDSLKCAKATRLVETFYDYLDYDAEVNQIATDGASALAEVTAFATAFFVGAGAAVIAEWVTNVMTGRADLDSDNYSIEIAAITADEEQKAELICVLTERVSAPVKIGNWLTNRVNDQDIKALLDTYLEVVNPTIRDAYPRTPILWLMQNATGGLATADCGCDQYLPHGYTPPLATGVPAIFRRMVFTSAGANTTSPNYATLPYEGYVLDPPHGSQAGANSFLSTWIGSASGTNYQAMGIMLEHPANFDLAGYKFDWDAQPGNHVVSINFELYTYNALLDQWTTHNVGTNTTEPQEILQFPSSTAVDVKYSVIWLKSGVSTLATRMTIQNIKVSGLLNDVGFVDLPLGQALT